MSREIKILINEDDSALEKRFSSLENALSKKNDNSFLIQEIRDLRKLVNERKDENIMAQKIGMIDNRLNSIFKMVTNRMDDMSSKLNEDKRNEIKDLISNNSKILVGKIEEGRKNYKDEMNNKIDAIENMLSKALAFRPQINNYTTNVSRGPQYVPYAA